jgi:RimJ/RimL family protein N-acetyltransferase
MDRMLEGLAPPDPPLSDGVVTLRLPDVERDTQTTIAISEDPEIQRWVLGGRPRPTAPHATLVGQLEMWRNRTDAIFSIDAAGHEQRVGLLRVLFGLVNPFGFAELGYSLLPEGRGRGYATRAVRLVADWVFDELGIGRLQARTTVGNTASERVLERAGFRREGIARAGWVLPVTGGRQDVTMWSLLPSDRTWAEPDIAQTPRSAPTR